MSTLPNAELPTVAIVGRPNVGKSTLFNRIAGRRVAIVQEQPGVTRDRKAIDAEWLGRPFRLVDTGGWLQGSAGIDAKVSAQSELAMRGADVVVMLVDGTSALTDEDAQVAAMLRRLDRPVLLAVNKIDHPGREVDIWDFVALGLGDPHPVSALHGRGAADLLDCIVGLLPAMPEPATGAVTAWEDSADKSYVAEDAEEAEDAGPVAVAIVGRPNVGKSTLFNRLIGEERAVVHDLPGTTRDSIDTVVDTDEGPIRFVDTAGMRRRSRIDEGTEYYSMVRALRSVDEADVALLVIDATDGVTHQDQRLAERVDAAGCPVVVLLNKWDAVDPDMKEDVVRQVGRRLRFLGEAPVLRISAANGRGVHRLIPAVGAALDAYHRRVPTRQVNDVVQAAQAAQPAPHGGRILYATQGATDPPTFTLFTNRELPKAYLRYIERKLREEFDLGATAVKLRVRRRS